MATKFLSAGSLAAISVGALVWWKYAQTNQVEPKPEEEVAEMDDAETLKSMGLYRNVERVFNQLKALGIGPNDKISPSFLSKYDQYHYYGTKACDQAIKALGIAKGNPEIRVLDIGSGIGGPARYVANKSGCSVTALEIQADLHRTASDLTKRCGLSSLVKHINGDILDTGLKDLIGERFSHVMSFLVFLHIQDKVTLMDHVLSSLKPGGKMFIEDFVFRGLPLSEREVGLLKEDVACEALLSTERYVELLTCAGFVNIKVKDMTAEWSDFVRERFQNFLSNYNETERIQGKPTAASLRQFYMAVDKLFRGGSVGGVQIICEKPSVPVPRAPSPLRTRRPVFPLKHKKNQIRTFTQDGLRRRAGCICLKDGKVLLVESAKYHDRWSLPGGGVEPDEETSIAAQRECFEEAGVKGRLGRFVGNYRDGLGHTQTSAWLLLVEEEVEEFPEAGMRNKKWVTFDEAHRHLAHKPLLVNILEDAREKASF